MRKIIIGVAVVLALGIGGACAPMILWERDTYRVEYTFDGVRHSDARVYAAWMDSRSYVHLPRAGTHSWWLLDPDRRMIYLPNEPRRRWGLWWKPPGREPGAAIDFEVKVGAWDWAFTDDEIRFANNRLACVLVSKVR